MKITIDTKEDSPEEIKKLISLLSSLAEGKDVVSNKDIFGQQELPKENVLGNLFETERANEATKEDKLEKKEVTKKDAPGIEIY